jgi:uncharacterized protein involved in outer membrane biogenesis
MKKLLVRILVVMAALVVVAFLLRNVIARSAVEAGVKHRTGFPIEIGSVDLGVFGGTIEVQNLKLMNPPEQFPEKMFVDLPKLRVDYHTLSMLTGSPHIKEVSVNVTEVVIVKNAKGQTNAQVLQAKVSPPSAGTTQPKGKEPPKPEPSGGAHYRVDLVRVHVGTVRIIDYSKGSKPTEKKMTLNKDVVFQDVTESTSITALVMRTVFGQVGEVAGEFVKGLNEATKSTQDALQKSSQGLFDSIKKAVPAK